MMNDKHNFNADALKKALEEQPDMLGDLGRREATFGEQFPFQGSESRRWHSDGKVETPPYESEKTVSQRFSGTSPNFQNIPKSKEDWQSLKEDFLKTEENGDDPYDRFEKFVWWLEQHFEAPYRKERGIVLVGHGRGGIGRTMALAMHLAQHHSDALHVMSFEGSADRDIQNAMEMLKMKYDTPNIRIDSLAGLTALPNLTVKAPIMNTKKNPNPWNRENKSRKQRNSPHRGGKR